MTSRVESVCSARWMRSNHSRVLADEVGRVGDVLRRLGVHLRLRLLRPLLGLRQPLLQFADAGEVLVELVAVAGAEPSDCSVLRLLADGVEDALAVLRAGGLWASTSSGRPSRNSLANTLDGQDSDGTGAPLRVHDRPKPSHDSGRLGNRVWPRRCSAANWSSEMVLRKPARCSGCGAPVRKLKMESWLGPTSGCDSPEMTVKSSRKSLRTSRYGESS